MELNRENIVKWVADLRSGQFPQTQGHLRTKDGFCCLGVACETAITNGVPVQRTFPELDDEKTYFYDGESGTLPDDVAEWLGFGTSNPEFTIHYKDVMGLGYHDLVCLTELNDLAALTFDQIADVIEYFFLGDNQNES